MQEFHLLIWQNKKKKLENNYDINNNEKKELNYYSLR